jgi:hypothetical protein
LKERDKHMASTIYKASTDSYSGNTNDLKKMVGTWQVRGLSKQGLKTHDSERLMAFYYYAYQSSLSGYDYVVLSDKRTNSGREEAVLSTTKCVSFGKKLCESGYAPSQRKAYDHPAKLCKGDFRTPTLEEPKYYADLPELPVAKPVVKSDTNPHEDELLALIDCITGTGNRAKAFRAIARYLIQESINMDEEEKEREGI